MNFGVVNGFGLNGSGSTLAVIRATAAGTAAATAASVDALVARRATATGTATATGSVSPIRERRGAASNTAGATSSVTASIAYAGRTAPAIAQASGNAAVRRDVSGAAVGIASATGEAIAASKLGTATGTATGTGVLINAHRVRPHAGIGTATATGTGGTPLATRYARVLATSGIETSYADPTIKKSGESFKRHFGFVFNARATATPALNGAGIIAYITRGPTGSGEATASVRAHKRHPGRANGLGFSSAEVGGRVIVYKAAGDDAEATGSAVATRRTWGRAQTTALATAVQARSVNLRAGYVDVLAEALAQVTPTRIAPGEARNDAELLALAADAEVEIYGYAQASAGALAILAYAFSNADVRAPDDRYMIVPYGGPAMIVAADDRLMRVEA